MNVIEDENILKFFKEATKAKSWRNLVALLQLITHNQLKLFFTFLSLQNAHKDHPFSVIRIGKRRHQSQKRTLCKQTGDR